MANADRGEVEIEIGGAKRTLSFRIAEQAELERLLGKDVLAFLAASGGQMLFLINAIVCGLARTEKKRPSPATVAEWIGDYQGDPNELQRQILYAIARGKPKVQAQELVRILDEMFSREAAEVEVVPVPLARSLDGISGP